MWMTRTWPLLMLAALAACGGPTREDEANLAAANDVDTVIVPEEDAPETAPDEDRDPFDRLGPVRIGARAADLRSAGVAIRTDEPLPGSTCSYARITSLPDVFLMLDGPVVTRIDVATPTHPTLGGLRVGQSEAEALRRLGGRAVVQPHPYTGPEGHYLVVHEAGAPRGLIVETNGKTVQSYRFGNWEQVQWVEGCA